MGTNTTQTMNGDCIIEKKKKKTKEEIVPDENIMFSLPKIPTILDSEDFKIKQEIKTILLWRRKL